MLIIGAIVLVVGVVASLAAVIYLDLRKLGRSQWVGELKQWQTLIGSVLGFIGAAGVLVLGFAVESEQSQKRAEQAAHAIGMGLALEAEKLALGLQVGRQIGQSIDLGKADLRLDCVTYSQALQRALAPSTPVYDALLDNMVDFGDANLAIFVRFHAFYEEFLRGLPEIDETACAANAEDEIRYIMSQIEGGMSFYEIIARRYDIAPAQPVATGVAAPAEGERT